MINIKIFYKFGMKIDNFTTESIQMFEFNYITHSSQFTVTVHNDNS
jgi:hypothetical protein